jgi:hypothetical protein
MLMPTIPVPLAKLITQMLELDEQQRPESAAVVKEELEKILKSGQIEEKGKAEVERKEIAKTEKVGPQLDPTVYVGPVGQNVWDRINLFFHKIRVPAWICFMVLSVLLGFWNANALNDDFSDAPSFWVSAVGISAALVGLVFLLVKRRDIVDILGGIAFILLSDILLFACGYEKDILELRSYDNFPYVITPLCISINIFVLLLLGVRFFVHSTSIRIGSIVGTLIMIVGLVLFISTPTLDDSPFSNLARWLSIAQILLGIVTIIIPLRKRRQNKHIAQLS